MRTLADPPDAPATPPPPPPGAVVPLQTDPTVAAALFAAWSGDPAVVVASPPGAGKTRLVVHLAEQLHRRAALNVAIAAQTRVQALDLTNRAAAIGARVADTRAETTSDDWSDPDATSVERAASRVYERAA